MIKRINALDLLDVISLENELTLANKDNFYPPFNTYTIGENEERSFIELAVTGFKKKELKAYFNEDGLFVIEGQKERDTSERVYYERNLSGKDFIRKFHKPKNTELESVKVENGLMTVEFIKVTPEIDFIKIQ